MLPLWILRTIRIYHGVVPCPVRSLRRWTKSMMEIPDDNYSQFLSREIANEETSQLKRGTSNDRKENFDTTTGTSIGNGLDGEVTELNEPVASKKGLCPQTVADNIRSSKKDPHSFAQKEAKLDEVHLSKILRKNLIYADKNLIIFNKPEGITAHDEIGSSGKASIRPCLPILSKMIYGLNTSVPLTLCNRLDKNTTGLTICATNRDVAHDVKMLFREQKVRRKYWGVTVGVPSPRDGFVDIPLVQRRIDSGFNVQPHNRMSLFPKQKFDQITGHITKVNHRMSHHAATTYYRTLDANGGLALVEYQPFTSVKHQLRVHAAEALSCPLLGDHKYSNNDKLLPQRLPKTVLKWLNIKSTRSRDLKMHLHLREIIIPGILENATKPNLLLSAKPPEYMFRTLKLFRLKPGPQTDFKYPQKTETPLRNNPNMEELYHDPFNQIEQGDPDIVQRPECFAVYKPKVKVKFTSKPE